MTRFRRLVDLIDGLLDVIWGIVFLIAGLAIVALGVVRDEPTLLLIGALGIVIGVLDIVVLGPRRNRVP